MDVLLRLSPEKEEKWAICRRRRRRRCQGRACKSANTFKVPKLFLLFVSRYSAKVVAKRLTKSLPSAKRSISTFDSGQLTLTFTVYNSATLGAHQQNNNNNTGGVQFVCYNTILQLNWTKEITRSRYGLVDVANPTASRLYRPLSLSTCLAGGFG